MYSVVRVKISEIIYIKINPQICEKILFIKTLTKLFIAPIISRTPWVCLRLTILCDVYMSMCNVYYQTGKNENPYHEYAIRTLTHAKITITKYKREETVGKPFNKKKRRNCRWEKELW